MDMLLSFMKNQDNRIKLSYYKETEISNSFCGDEHGCVNQKFHGYYLPKDYIIKDSDNLSEMDIYEVYNNNVDKPLQNDPF